MLEDFGLVNCFLSALSNGLLMENIFLHSDLIPSTSPLHLRITTSVHKNQPQAAETFQVGPWERQTGLGMLVYTSLPGYIIGKHYLILLGCRCWHFP